MTTATDAPPPAADEQRLMTLLHSVIGDFGAVGSAALVVIGDKLGLYKALQARGASTPDELAAATGTSERYLRHWLLNQAVSGYVDYDAATGRYGLSPEQTMVFAMDDTPVSFVGGFGLITAAIKAEPRIAEAFKTGGGLAWGDHDDGLFAGTERFFRPGYIGSLVQDWIPALDGVRAKLERGAKVADVGCGHGASTVIMAQAYPASRFVGFDSHEPSIQTARQAAEAAGVADRVTFEVARAQDFPGDGYDLVTLFDCLHDFGDPEGAAEHIRQALDPAGAVMLVEPMAGDRPEDNFNPVGRVYSAASVLVCTPHALSETGRALGTLATDDELRKVFVDAGYKKFARVTETPTNRVFEATL